MTVAFRDRIRGEHDGESFAVFPSPIVKHDALVQCGPRGEALARDLGARFHAPGEFHMTPARARKFAVLFSAGFRPVLGRVERRYTRNGHNLTLAQAVAVANEMQEAKTA